MPLVLQTSETPLANIPHGSSRGPSPVKRSDLSRGDPFEERVRPCIQAALDGVPISVSGSTRVLNREGRFALYFAGLAREALLAAIVQTCDRLSDQALVDPCRVGKALQWILEKPPIPFAYDPISGSLLWRSSPASNIRVVVSIPVVKLAQCLTRCATVITEAKVRGAQTNAA